MCLILGTAKSYGQSLTPENNTFHSELIRPESYQMKWFMLQDTTKIEIGLVTTEIKKMQENTLFITKVDMPSTTSQWVDSTIVRSKDLEPIYHSSYNQNRDMAINFGKRITGYYLDKTSNEKILLDETDSAAFFDSNSYPQLIRWLPLKNHYKQTISIFDFNPKAKTGLLEATIKNVESDMLLINNKEHDVWKVYVTDDISDNQVISTLYIDKATRSLLKQEMEMPGRKMVMEQVKKKEQTISGKQ
ncbi:hypothetical protein PY092_16025 [Muricauda sp. 334s03]|uniref:Outer membrane lipoprotein-sorting protein n=1 Tax=Flagellimonas yonaguniensis TaxID=3031325 RepID=A0ABT5Y3R0_9FLAO|nr:hypothetical protein [[Muricauda] yonaguniensis]MDF0717672.1 hypothetical protein [[Muricauda] yonaguniensis]